MENQRLSWFLSLGLLGHSLKNWLEFPRCSKPYIIQSRTFLVMLFIHFLIKLCFHLLATVSVLMLDSGHYIFISQFNQHCKKCIQTCSVVSFIFLLLLQVHNLQHHHIYCSTAYHHTTPTSTTNLILYHATWYAPSQIIPLACWPPSCWWYCITCGCNPKRGCTICGHNPGNVIK